MDTVPIAAASLGQVHVDTVRITSQYYEPFSYLVIGRMHTRLRARLPKQDIIPKLALLPHPSPYPM